MAELAGEKPKPIKRFYKKVSLKEEDGTFALMLDDRAAKTPRRKIFTFETKRLGKAITEEWDRQAEELDFATMPLTRLQMTVLDAQEETRAIWRETPKRFITTDLISFRAERPEKLVEMESQYWDPFYQWARGSLGMTLPLTSGLEVKPLAPDTLERLEELLSTLNPGQMLALALACELTGSAILGLAMLKRMMPAENIFAASHVGETFQEEKWGEDDEALARRAQQREEFLSLDLFLGLSASHEN